MVDRAKLRAEKPTNSEASVLPAKALRALSCRSLRPTASPTNKSPLADHPSALDSLGHNAAQSLLRGCAGLSELPRPNATHRVDNTTESHQRHPRLRRSQTPTAVARLKNPENLEGDSIPITKGRVSSAFSLTRAVTGRINKQEPTHAKPLEREIRPRQPSSLSFFNPVPAPNSGTHPSGATK